MPPGTLGHAGWLEILAVTSPIFILIAIGFLAVRTALLPREGVRMLGTYVIHFALPALLFKALSERSLEQILHPVYLAGYGLGSLAAFALMLCIGGRLRGRGLSGGTILALGSSISNSAFIGYPILLQLLGPVVLVPFALTLIIENTLMMPLILALAESGTHREERFLRALAKALPRLARNPIILGILLGGLSSALAFKLPAVPGRVVEMLAASSGPLALFVIGGSLVGLRLRGLLPDLGQILVGKLLIHPLSVLTLFWLLPPVDPAYRVAAVVLACVPMSSIYPILGHPYRMEGTCAAALLGATVLSFGSISLWIWGLGRFGF